MICARCQHDNPDGARFCNQCGAPAMAAAGPEARRLTVMFCDIVGSVEWSSGMDPEDWHALLDAYQAAVGDAIHRHQGHVAQHLGDGVVAYFGYPLASEDDAERAVLAALQAVAAVGTLPVGSRQAHPARLQVRVGLHTGSVVMADVGKGVDRAHLALGDTPNIAARLQALALPDTVLVSAATQRVVQSRFGLVDLGERALKGLAAPVRVFQVSGLRAAEGDDDTALRARLPLLGRAQEWDLLAAQWQASVAGPGCRVLLQGEPGIGKSRLVRELRRHVEREGARVWLLRCSAHRAHTPFAPLAQLLGRAIAGLAPDSEARATALSTALADLGIADTGTLAPLAALLDIEWPADRAPAPLSAQALRERTFTAATAVVHAGAAKRPTLLVVEDLHWSDPSTLEWLGRLLALGRHPRLMILLTARGEFRAPWLQDGVVTQLSLEPCTTEDATALVLALDPAHALGAEAVARIVQRADGNPLYLEEFTRSALESGGDEIPATLQEQTLARLDRLGPAKLVLQQAAVIGRRFGLRRLRAVCPQTDEALAAALQRGVDAHLLTRLAEGGGEVFAFRHALLHDAARASLLRSARQACHLRVAQAILAEDPAAADHQPEMLAAHYAEAGQPAVAVVHWLRAGQQALARSACIESAGHAQRALALLQPGANDDDALELELQLVLAPALMAVHGVLDARVEQAYKRAGQLCELIGHTPKLLVPLWGLWAYELMRGQVEQARGTSGQIAALARSTPQPLPSLVAAATLGMTLFYAGELAAARAEFTKGIALYRAPRQATRTVRGVHDPGVMCHAFDMLACWLMGESEAARAGSGRLRELAPVLAPYDAAFMWCADALLAALREDPAATCESAARAKAIAGEQAFTAWQLMATVLQGWGRAMQGQAQPGIAQMQRGFDAWCATGAHNLQPLFRALLAQAWLAAGQAQPALQSADEGLASAATGERCWVPELQRLRGLALAALGQRAAALQALDAALAGADRMGAAAWRARAAASLSLTLDAARSQT